MEHAQWLASMGQNQASLEIKQELLEAAVNELETDHYPQLENWEEEERREIWEECLRKAEGMQPPLYQPRQVVEEYWPMTEQVEELSEMTMRSDVTKEEESTMLDQEEPVVSQSQLTIPLPMESVLCGNLLAVGLSPIRASRKRSAPELERHTYSALYTLERQQALTQLEGSNHFTDSDW